MLILPKTITPRKEHVQRLCEHFKGVLEDKVNDNQHRTEPYWIIYKLKCQKMQSGRPFDQFCYISEFNPPKSNGSLCYKIDNVAGTKHLEWVVHA